VPYQARIIYEVPAGVGPLWKIGSGKVPAYRIVERKLLFFWQCFRVIHPGLEIPAIDKISNGLLAHSTLEEVFAPAVVHYPVQYRDDCGKQVQP